MADTTIFKVPEFLEDKSPEKIHAQMKEAIPQDIDMSAGQYPYDLTYPTALVVSEIAQADLPRLIRQIWPQFATEVYLDYHAKLRKMSRKPAQSATGTLIISGDSGTVIPEGSIFSTVSRNDNVSIRFKSLSAHTLGDSEIEVKVEAVNPGKQGNVNANTILLVISEDLKGIKSVNNPEPTTGGYDEESDDELRKRILYFDKNISNSFIGNVADYIRWATAVGGVGSVEVISAQDDSGIVTLVITDRLNEPATETLCQNVYDYIMTDANEMKSRLAPINANLRVIPSQILNISISAIVKLKKGYTLSDVKSSFISSINKYLSAAKKDGEIRYSKICNILGDAEGVYDTKNILLNGDNLNIQIEQGIIPITSDDFIDLAEGVI